MVHAGSSSDPLATNAQAAQARQDFVHHRVESQSPYVAVHSQRAPRMRPCFDRGDALSSSLKQRIEAPMEESIYLEESKQIVKYLLMN